MIVQFRDLETEGSCTPFFFFFFSSRDFFGYDCVYVQGPPFCFWET